MSSLAEELRERTAMRYAGGCKCGKCQLVPREMIDRAVVSLTSPPPVSMALLELAAEAMWRRDYPNGGSIFKSYASLHYRDKEIHRKEAFEAAALSSEQEK